VGLNSALPLLRFWIALLLLSACSPQAAAPARTLPPPNVTVLPYQSPAPSPTGTLSVEAEIAPYTIAGLRVHDFKGGNISLLAQTGDTKIYKRYRIAYPSDGLTITGVLQIPADGQAPFPVIVMNHGYFNRESYSSGDGTDRAAEFLNRRGYLTLSPDYRSWGLSDIGPSLFYSGLAIDVVNLINSVGSIPQADPDRIGIWGHSMGGGVTMKVLMVDTPVKSAVLYSTVSADNAELIERWGPGCSGDIAAGESYYGCNSSDILPADLAPPLKEAYFSAARDTELLRDTSPIHHLDLVKVPVQIHYGTDDGKVFSGTPPEWSRELYQGLRQAGVESELFAYDGQEHSFRADAWFAFMERTAQFFDRTVKDPPPPASTGS
jgi:dipeptidyl aminopeptidase/acylaminoacyl peptidase